MTGLTGHPRGLGTIFLTEMWERFSYYGMRALLVLYLVDQLDYARPDALEVYATYTALVYLSPILGGYLADRWLGNRRAVLIGALLMSAGHFAMAFESLLNLALGLLIAGNGFFKPNLASLVGQLYAPDDARRDGGFTIYYMGINLGAFLAPLVCGTLGEKLGWHWGFAAAGVGMLLGLTVFALGQHRLGDAGLAADQRGRTGGLDRRDWGLSLLVSLVVGLLVWAGVASLPWIAPWWDGVPVLVRIGLGVGGAVVIWVVSRLLRGDDTSAPRLTADDWQRILALFIVGMFWIVFWMGFEQAGGTMNLFAFEKTDRVVGGWEVPASYFQAVNPLLILLLAPLFTLMWLRLDRSRHALSPTAKQGIGMIILGLGFVVLAIADARAETVGKVAPWWLLAVYFLHTSGELCLSPIGLSMVSKLAPAHLGSLLMGLWFTTLAIASYLAGTLEALLAGSGVPLYWFLVGSSIGMGLLLLLITPLLRRLMRL